MKRMLYSNFEGFASNSAVIMPLPSTLPYKGFKKGMNWDFTIRDVENIRRQMPELELISPQIQRSSKINNFSSTGIAQAQCNVNGVEPAFQPVMNPIIVSGRFINDVDVAKESKVCVIGENLANKLFNGAEVLGRTVQIDNYMFRIVGVMKQSGEVNLGGRLEDNVIIPITTGRRIYNLGTKIEMILIVAKDGYRPSELRPKLYHILRANHPLHPEDEHNMMFLDLSEIFEEIGKVFSGVDFLLLFVGFSSLLAGVIGIGNIMWIIVKERTKEFGIRRALGAKPLTIMGQILSESAVLTVIAGMTAIVAATGILYSFTAIVKQQEINIRPEAIDFQLSFGNAMAILLMFIVLGCLVGTIPAIKAMRIKPIEALNDK